MFGQTEVSTALNVSAITNLLDAFGSGKALFNDLIIPQSFTGKKSINYYLISPVNGGNEVEQYEYSINCRAETFIKSQTMASTVYNTLNRVHGINSFKICSVLQTIPPADSTDVFNTPVSLKLLKR